VINIDRLEVLFWLVDEEHLLVKDVVEHVWDDIGDSVSDVLENNSSLLLVGLE